MVKKTKKHYTAMNLVDFITESLKVHNINEGEISSEKENHDKIVVNLIRYIIFQFSFSYFIE